MKQLIKEYIHHQLVNRLPVIPINPISKRNNIGLCSTFHRSKTDMFIATVQSLFSHLGYALPIYLVDDPPHGDGQLTQKDIVSLRKHFTVIIEPNSQQKMKKLLQPYKYFSKYRFDTRTGLAKFKYDTLLLNPFAKYIYIDQDILFFDYPREVDQFIRSSKSKFLYFSRIDNAYKAYPELLFSEDRIELFIRKLINEYLQRDCDEYFTSGMLCVPSKSMLSLDKFDKIFQLYYEVNIFRNWVAEERAISEVIDLRDSIKLPPLKYFTATYRKYYQTLNRDQVTAIHYQGLDLKKQFISDSINEISKNLVNGNSYEKY